MASSAFVHTLEQIIKKLFKYDSKWCTFWNIYRTPFQHTSALKFKWPKELPRFDSEAYKRYPKYRFVYDKLWIAKSQYVKAGKLSHLVKNPNKVSYPIFIKPRWGHESASSRGCFKIDSSEMLKEHSDTKDMMWSEFIDGTENMTDFIILKGRIVHQITYVYSEKQHGFTDAWKYLSPYSTPPQEIIEWAESVLSDFTGVANVQYRNNIIVECGLRLARQGAYIKATGNKQLAQNISQVITNHYWNFSNQNSLHFDPIYIFKCYTTYPILYIWSKPFLDYIVTKFTDHPFYEYYFETVGHDGCVYLQFSHTDLNKGLEAKKQIETWFDMTQIIMMIALASAFVLLIFNNTYTTLLAIIIFVAFLTRFINPFQKTFSSMIAQSQRSFPIISRYFSQKN